MKVLMIAYEFPPGAAGGVMRTVKHCKYLPQWGWHPHVLTPRHTTLKNSDASLLQELRSTTRVHRCPSWEYDAWLRRLGESSRWPRLSRALEWRVRRILEPLAKPDAMRFWAMPAVFAGMRVCRRESVDALYSTSWPYSDHWAGLWLHRLTKLPWVADFRDPWLQHYNYGQPDSRRDRWNRRLESQICRNASYVVSATASATRALRASHPEIPPTRFVTIRNGFDAADFAEPAIFDPAFSIVHVGSFYGSRNPAGFWRGVKQFLDAIPEARSDLEITFAGSMPEEANSLPPGIRWKSLPWVSHRQALRIMRQAAVLLMVQHRESAVRLTVPGKLYEYMASGRHILCLNTQPGENAGLLRAYRNSTLLWDDQADHVASALEVLYRRYRAGTLQIEPRTEFVHRFSRRASAERLADLLTRAVESAKAPEAREPARRSMWEARGSAGDEEGLLCTS